MMRCKYPIALALLLVLARESAWSAVSATDVTFYASFEHGFDADTAAGNMEGKLVGDHEPLSVAGVVGKGLRSEGPCSLRYDAPGNLAESKGCLTFWYYTDHVKTNQCYNFFNIDAGERGYTYLYRLPTETTVTLVSLVRTPGAREAAFHRLNFPMVEEEKWHFIAVNWEGTKTKEVNVYVDGRIAAHGTGYAFPEGWEALHCDLSPSGTMLDELTIYNRILSQAEILALYHRTGSLHTDNVMSISKSSRPRIIDGRVTDEEWRDCASTVGFCDLKTGLVVKPQGRIALSYDDRFLYLALESAIPDDVLANIPNKLLVGLLKQTKKQYDSDVEADDAFGIHIVPDPAKRIWYRLVFNGIDTHYDYEVSPDKGLNLHWNPAWKSASTVDINGWHCEAAIPIAELRTPAPAVGTVWGMNFLRYWHQVRQGIQIWSWGVRDKETRAERFTPFHDTDHSNGVLGDICFAGDRTVNVRLTSLGNLNDGKVSLEAELINTDPSVEKKTVVTVQSNFEEAADEQSITLAPGTRKPYRYLGAVNKSTRLSFQVKSLSDNNIYFRSEISFQIHTGFDCAVAYYPGQDVLYLWMDLLPLSHIPLGQLRVNASVHQTNCERVLYSEEWKTITSYRPHLKVPCAILPAGQYEVIIDIGSKEPKPILSLSKPFAKKPLPEWFGNKIGISEKVPAPFTPLVADLRADTIACWGRKYEFGNRLFPQQVWTQGEAILKHGITLRLADEQGRVSESRDASCAIAWRKTGEARVESERRLTLGAFEITACSWIEYDGFFWTKLRVVPNQKGASIGRLELDIPFKKVCASLINTADYSTITTGKLKPEGWHGAALRPLWLGNEIGGMQWTNETDAEFSVAERETELRVVPLADQNVLRVTMADVALPPGRPFECEFGLVATPTRPRTPHYRHLNTDPVVRITFGQWYQTYFCDPSRIPKDSVFWNPPPRTGKINVTAGAPYSSTYTMAAETEEWRYWGGEWAPVDQYVYVPNLTLPAHQRTEGVCQSVRSWQDFYVWSYWKLYQAARFREIYHDDGIAPCTNTAHGCGRLTQTGLWPTSCVLGKREINKRLYTMLRELEKQQPDAEYPEMHGETYIVQHHSGYQDMAWASFCDYYADGENFTGCLARDGDYHRVYPPDAFRAQSMGHNFGPTCWFMDEFERAGIPEGSKGRRDGSGWTSYEPVWHLFGLILLHDSTYWHEWAPPDAYEPYIRTLRMCNWGDQYRMIPYWNQRVVKLPEGQFVTFYVDEKAKRVIMIFLNNQETGGMFDCALDLKALGIESWNNIHANSVHPVPTAVKDGKLVFLAEEWEQRWKTTPTAQINGGRLVFPFERACSRLIVIYEK